MSLITHQGKDMVDFFTERTSKELKYIRAVGSLEKSGENYTAKISQRSGLSRPAVNSKGDVLSDKEHRVVNTMGEGKQGHTYHTLTERGREMYRILSPLFRSRRTEEIKDAIRSYQKRTLRMPDKQEIRTQINFDLNERDLYSIDYYTEPTEDLKNRSKKELTTIIPIALAIHYDLKTSNAFMNASDEEKSVAEQYVKNNEPLLDRFQVQGKDVKNKKFVDNDENPTFRMFKAPEELRPFLLDDRFVLNEIILPANEEDIVWYPED